MRLYLRLLLHRASGTDRAEAESLSGDASPAAAILCAFDRFQERDLEGAAAVLEKNVLPNLARLSEGQKAVAVAILRARRSELSGKVEHRSPRINYFPRKRGYWTIPKRFDRPAAVGSHHDKVVPAVAICQLDRLDSAHGFSIDVADVVDACKFRVEKTVSRDGIEIGPGRHLSAPELAGLIGKTVT